MDRRTNKYYVIFFALCLFINASGIAQTLSNQDKILLNTEKTKIKIFPNPAMDYFSLDIDVQINYISVSNILGKEVIRFYSNKENKYPVSELRRGIYIIRIFNQEDQLLKAMRLSKA